jgi:ABC-type branched-subunit amino acid transport system substrate-binding protein/tRNA A-37 threonylcarbamoyl transferase component Bud32
MNMRDGQSDVPLPPPESSDGETGDPTPEAQPEETVNWPRADARPVGEKRSESDPYSTFDPPRRPREDARPVGEERSESDPFASFDPPRSPDERGRFAGYRILGLLGAGGMGLVYEAEDPVLRRRVALKVLRPEMAGPVVRVRFLREAQMAASLKDDHVVTIYQVSEHAGRPYLVMERLRGESLEQRLKRDRWLPVPEALSIARQITRGLRAAHAVGLVHRDIKPANIWLEEPADGVGAPRVKILDFGLAKPLRDDTELTQHGTVVGTPAYMAPEQLEGQPLDARADLYALGVVLYRMITGVPPFKAPNVARLLAAILAQDPPPVSSIRGRVPRPVEELLNDLLAKDPNRRPPSASIVAERLRAIEDHLTLVGGDEPAPKVCGGSTGSGRRPIGLEVWGGAVAVIASIVIGLAVLWQNLRRATGDAAPVPAGPRAVASAAKDRKASDGAGAKPATANTPAPGPSGPPIKVGLLHSLTGPLSSIERPMVEAENLAIDEINASGGLLGRTLVKAIGDGHSDEFVFAQTARELIERERVDVLVGCLSSASRKRVKEVCEQKDILLFYPMIFEGLEQSADIVYVGGGPNQQLLPMVRWAIGFFDPPRRRFFLLGNESLFSRAGQELFRGELAKHGLEPVGVRSVPNGQLLGFDVIIDEIRRSKADIVLDTLDVESDQMFFKNLGRLGIKAVDLPVVSICLGEGLLRTLDRRLITGHYSALNYFEAIDTPENARFLERLRAKHAILPANAAVESAYVSVLIWKQAVEKAGSLESAKVRTAVAGLELKAPEGRLRIAPDIYYGSRVARIGRMRDDGKFEILFESPGPMPTFVYPPPHDRAGWENFLAGLSQSWGGRWTGETAAH